MKIKTIVHGGTVTETKQTERNGVPVGIVEGYIATWDVDRGDWTGIRDKFLPGAFLESIERHRATNRPVRLKDQHQRTIGGFPIASVLEDERGLFGRGEINLDVQQGREAFALAKQGILSDFSIGWQNIESNMIANGIREILKAEIWEGSLVDEPMNPHANITAVKSVVSFQDLPLADRQRPWDSGQAVSRLRAFTDSDDEPSRSYRRGFVWFDSDAPENFESYKLPIADVVDGRLMAIPRAIFAAAAAMRGARGGINIPANDRSAIINHLERDYQKLDLESPFGEAPFRIDDLLAIDARTLEGLCKDGIRFTNQGAKQIISNFKTAGLLRYEQAVHRDGVIDKANEILTLLEG